MAIVKKRAVIRRVGTNPPTYAYIFEPQPYNSETVEAADTQNTAGQTHTEVGQLSVNNAPPNGVLVRAIYEYEWFVPDPQP